MLELARGAEILFATELDGATVTLILREMEKKGGIMTEADLKNYHSVWRKPLEFDWKDMHVITMAPPSSGGIILRQLLVMVSEYPLKKYGFHSAEAVHLMAEAELAVGVAAQQRLVFVLAVDVDQQFTEGLQLLRAPTRMVWLIGRTETRGSADYPVIQYCILMFAVFFIAINLATDLLTQWMDPRTRQPAVR